MKTKNHSWKSYAFITVSVLVTLSMFLLDPVSRATSERATGPMLVVIVVGALLSIILALLSFFSKNERKLIPIVALIFTIFNLGIMILFFVLGMGFS